MIILHGDHFVQSRAKLLEIISQARENQQPVITLEAKILTLAELEEALGGSSLFNPNQLIIIEQLHSLPKSKKKNALLDFLAIHQANTSTAVVLIEKKALTATQLKKFPQAQVLLFKISNQLFAWLDSFVPSPQPTHALQLLSKALKHNEATMCFYLLIRQIRLLIQVKDRGNLKLPGFMLAKLQKQAQQFTLDQLLALEQQLLQIDYQQKTSHGFFNWQQSLEQLHLQFL